MRRSLRSYYKLQSHSTQSGCRKHSSNSEAPQSVADMSYRVYDCSDRRSVVAMEEFAQIMESPMFLQTQRAHPHLYSSFSDSFGSRANYRPPEPQPQVPFSDSFGLGHVQPIPEPHRHHHDHHRHHHDHHHHQPQLSLSDNSGHVQRGPEPRHLHYQQQQLQQSPSDSFGRAQRLPEAHYSRAQAAEYDVVAEPVKRAEKHHSTHEESIDREAGDFIKLRHKKFELSK